MASRSRTRLGRPVTLQQVLAGAVSEDQWTEWVISVAERGGWSWWHFKDSRRQVAPGEFVGDAGAAGFPDLVLARPGVGVVFAELKTETGRPRPKQREALNDLSAAGQLAVLWRPRHAEVVTKVLIHADLTAADWWEAA